MVYGEAGQYNIFYNVYQRMINYWIQISNGKESKLSCIMYRLMYNMFKDNVYQFKWLLKIKYILDYCGFSNIFTDLTLVSTKWLKASINRKLKDICIQNWLSELNTNSVCINYRIFKIDPCIENYLKLSEKLRIPLTKFRCGNHRLPVSAHRFEKNIPDVCTLCNSGDVGDEFHTLLKCSELKNDRLKCIKKYYIRNPNTLKFNELLNSHNQKELANLAHFIKIIMTKFR